MMYQTCRYNIQIILLFYKCFHNHAPLYPTELLALYSPERNIRMSKNYLFIVAAVLMNAALHKGHNYDSPMLCNYPLDCVRSINSIKKLQVCSANQLFKNRSIMKQYISLKVRVL